VHNLRYSTEKREGERHEIYTRESRVPCASPPAPLTVSLCQVYIYATFAGMFVASDYL